MLRKYILAVLLAAMAFSFYGCQKPEQTARDAIAAAKGVVETAQIKYLDACQADPDLGPCVTVNKAVAAQNLAIDALNQYCSGPGYLTGGVCNPQPDLQSHLEAALASLDQTIKDVEALIQ